jgi:hypothetical protein
MSRHVVMWMLALALLLAPAQYASAGITKTILKAGKGPMPQKGDQVTVGVLRGGGLSIRWPINRHTSKVIRMRVVRPTMAMPCATPVPRPPSNGIHAEPS